MSLSSNKFGLLLQHIKLSSIVLIYLSKIEIKNDFMMT